MSTSSASSRSRAARGSATTTETSTPGWVARRESTPSDTKVAAALATAATDTGPLTEPDIRSRSARAEARTSTIVPRAGERHAAGRTVEQSAAGLAFEHGQLLRDRGRGKPEGAGRRGDRAP